MTYSGDSRRCGDESEEAKRLSEIPTIFIAARTDGRVARAYKASLGNLAQALSSRDKLKDEARWTLF